MLGEVLFLAGGIAHGVYAPCGEETIDCGMASKGD